MSPHISIISFYSDLVNIRIKYYESLYYLDFQYTLHDLAGGFLVLIERVGVDVQCSRCGILKQGVPKDIDKYVDEILDKM